MTTFCGQGLVLAALTLVLVTGPAALPAAQAETAAAEPAAAGGGPELPERSLPPDRRYNALGGVRPWEGRDEHDVVEELRRAMAQNPVLQVVTKE